MVAMKAQTIRLVDVFVLGPFGVWAARYMPTPAARAMMTVTGVATMLYNGANYLRKAGLWR